MDVNAEINGWKIFVHPCFSSQLEVLVEEVEALKEKNPEGFHKKAATKLLAAVLKVIHSEICADPSQVKFRQGSTLGDANKHWFRAKFLMQYRLFFRYSEPHKTIILAWINDEDTKRAYGSKRDAYKVFAAMLASGHPPSDWDELLQQSQVAQRLAHVASQS
ncbi:type II toxin-antitoxin system YhaV family toxin [Pantoea sp. Taur]|jgi:toxin YhaV|uniref:type II toxin-antitoxin system YhaV family toxin n=1 Tax=Pantoea sp. Taur TaxID=2576757 RepID=UPI001355EA5B|nr:type II toxin-antitoxin system YhaV family toxin [Pantoea sp. Taur]MXP57380.1 type II toxin-antitoxin system YhaV family toxin [Pantoea sp. Taur]